MKLVKHLYAVIRIDFDRLDLLRSPSELDLLFKVKKVVETIDEAEAEVERLNKLNADKGCAYVWQTTRLEESPSASG